MPGPKRGFTSPHTCATVDSMARNQPLERDRNAHEKLQEKESDFQVSFNGNVYLSIGLEANHDIYNSFVPSKPYDIHLEPTSHDHPPLVKIKQKGKPSVYTIDFYFTNKLASNIVIRSQGTNNTSPNTDQAGAAEPTFFKADPLQPGEVCLHLWMLYTPQAPMLDLTGGYIKTKEDIKGHKAKQSK